MSELRITLDEFLDFVSRQGKSEDLWKAVNKAIDVRRSNTPKEEFLNHRSLRWAYQQSFKGGTLTNRPLLRRLLLTLEITPDELFKLQIHPSPWDSWIPGQRVVVLLGGKVVQHPDADTRLSQRAVGAHDAEAFLALRNVLQHHARIEYKGDLELVVPPLSRKDAQAHFTQVLERRNVGAIIALGSERVNPLVPQMVRRMFPGTNPRDLPARFRWSVTSEDVELALSESDPCDANREGIILQGHRDTTVHRMRDDEIRRHLDASTSKGPRRRFPDCGILAIDTVHRPMLILCAGHGGCGTVATVYGLRRGDYIEDSLKGDRMERGKSFEIVGVHRRKRTNKPVDDLYFDTKYDDGWAFYWDQKANFKFAMRSRR